MKGLIPKNILTDTCFWFALYEKQDQYHEVALRIFDTIQNARIIIPWPVLYEILNTRFVKQQIWITRFEKLIKRNNIIRFDDSKYREKALEYTFSNSISKNWSISLVDNVIRQILSDTQVNIGYLVTFNEKDFIDILKRRPNTQLYNS